MITLDQYFWNPQKRESKPRLPEHDMAATDLLKQVNEFLDSLHWQWPIDPDTQCSISGSKGGTGDGGFRAADSSTGAPHSMHRRAHAVDVYDPKNELDGMLTDELLEEAGLYREHPDSTPGWCHLQNLPPRSGHRTFYP